MDIHIHQCPFLQLFLNNNFRPKITLHRHLEDILSIPLRRLFPALFVNTQNYLQAHARVWSKLRVGKHEQSGFCVHALRGCGTKPETVQGKFTLEPNGCMLDNQRYYWVA